MAITNATSAIGRELAPVGLLASLLPNAFARRAAILTFAGVIAQCVTLVAAPILTRLYTPEDFGLLGLFTSVSSVLLVFVSGKYEHAIALAKTERGAANVLVLSLVITGATTLLAIPFVYLFGRLLAGSVGNPHLAAYLWMLPLTLAGGATYRALSSWALRRREVECVASTRVSQSFTRAATQVGLGVAHLGPMGLIIGDVLGQFAGCGTLLNRMRLTNRSLWRGISLSRMGCYARRYRRFPLIAMPSSCLNLLALSLPLMMVPLLFGPAQAGFFLLAQRLVSAPLTLIGDSISRLFYVTLAANSDDQTGNLRRFKRLTVRLVAGACAGGLITVLLARYTGLMFGPRWSDLGDVLLALVPLLMVRFVVSPIAQSLYVYDRQGLLLLLDSLRLFCVGAVLGGTYFASLDFLWMLYLYSGAMACCYVLYWIATWLTLKRSSRHETQPVSVN